MIVATQTLANIILATAVFARESTTCPNLFELCQARATSVLTNPLRLDHGERTGFVRNILNNRVRARTNPLAQSSNSVGEIQHTFIKNGSGLEKSVKKVGHRGSVHRQRQLKK